MKLIPHFSFGRSALPAVLLFISGLFLMIGCKEADVKLVNKVKTFEPKWASLNEKLNYIDRNLQVTEKRFEQDFSEIKGLLGTITDSLKGRNYKAMLDDYKSLASERDTLRIDYNGYKKFYVESVNTFNAWEKEVMGGGVSLDQGLADLDKYKSIHDSISIQADSMKALLEKMVNSHNTILRNLSGMMEIYTNYDIKIN